MRFRRRHKFMTIQQFHTLWHTMKTHYIYITKWIYFQSLPSFFIQFRLDDGNGLYAIIFTTISNYTKFVLVGKSYSQIIKLTQKQKVPLIQIDSLFNSILCEWIVMAKLPKLPKSRKPFQQLQSKLIVNMILLQHTSK